MYDLKQNYTRRSVELEKAVYEKLLKQYEQLMSAHTEGVFEVTVRSQNHTVTIPVAFVVGGGVACELADAFAKHVTRVENNLNSSIEELEHEDYKATAAAKEPLPTFNTRPARKSRKAVQPRPEVMEAVGQMAAEVPMNGSTHHAVARATNLPQG